MVAFVLFAIAALAPSSNPALETAPMDFVGMNADDALGAEIPEATRLLFIDPADGSTLSGPFGRKQLVVWQYPLPEEGGTWPEEVRLYITAMTIVPDFAGMSGDAGNRFALSRGLLLRTPEGVVPAADSMIEKNVNEAQIGSMTSVGSTIGVYTQASGGIMAFLKSPEFFFLVIGLAFGALGAIVVSKMRSNQTLSSS